MAGIPWTAIRARSTSQLGGSNLPRLPTTRSVARTVGEFGRILLTYECQRRCSARTSRLLNRHAQQLPSLSRNNPLRLLLQTEQFIAVQADEYAVTCTLQAVSRAGAREFLPEGGAAMEGPPLKSRQLRDLSKLSPFSSVQGYEELDRKAGRAFRETAQSRAQEPSANSDQSTATDPGFQGE